MITIAPKNKHIRTRLEVVLDGKVVGNIEKGLRKEFDVPTGSHEIYVREKPFLFIEARSNSILFNIEENNNFEFKWTKKIFPDIEKLLVSKTFEMYGLKNIIKNEKEGYMYCRNCGESLHDKAVVCVKCGVPPLVEKNFCNSCGTKTNPNQSLCIKCGCSLSRAGNVEKNKITAGLLALLLGGFAAHKFYLGYTKEAIITLLIIWLGLILFGVPTIIMAVIVFIEGIIYLAKTDQEFQRIYVDNKKPWF